jgi:4-hydroxymandelate oxidase
MEGLDLTSVEDEARTKLDQTTYDWIAGGAELEETLRANVTAWSRFRVRPRVLRDVVQVDTRCTLLGSKVRSPIGIAPTSRHGLSHPDAEIATVRGAGRAGCLMTLSSSCDALPDDVVQSAGKTPLWFQLYVTRDRDQVAERIRAAAAMGFRALVVTVDTPVSGDRRRSGGVMPFAAPHRTLEAGGGPDPGLVFSDLTWLAEVSQLPVVAKGVLRGDDARLCVEMGASGVWVSNHGGRQLDGAVATADALSDVVDAVDARAEVYVDGGIRRGVDVLRACALGATAVFVGRPVVWGLTCAGEDGVATVLEALHLELERAMRLSGVASLRDATRDLVVGDPA